MAPMNKALQQGMMYPYRFVRGKLSKPTGMLEQLQPGEGAIVELAGKKWLRIKMRTAR